MKLPEPTTLHGSYKQWYTEAQLLQFGRECLEEAAKVCADLGKGINVNGQNGRYKECATEIRKLIGELK